MSQHRVAGPPRRSSLHDLHVRAGARFTRFGGWEMPLQFSGIVAEHEATRRAAAVFDVSHLGRVVLEGPGAGAALRSVTTYDVTGLDAGRAHYSLYCNEAGGIEDDVFVYRLAAERWLVAHNAANAEADLARVRSAGGASIEDIGAGTAMVAVQGPEALDLLAGVAGADFASLPRHGATEVAWGAGRLMVARTGYTGEDGAECVVGVADAAPLWERLVAAGATPAGLGARDTLRLEAALPLHGADIGPSTNPFEAGLGFAVSLDDEHPFVGRDALVQLKGDVQGRRLACLRADGRIVLRAGLPVLDPGRADSEVGSLTSGSFSPTLARGIGMAYLPRERAAPGTRLATIVRGSKVPLEVVRRPFYRPGPGKEERSHGGS